MKNMKYQTQQTTPCSKSTIPQGIIKLSRMSSQ